MPSTQTNESVVEMSKKPDNRPIENFKVIDTDSSSREQSVSHEKCEYRIKRLETTTKRIGKDLKEIINLLSKRDKVKEDSETTSTSCAPKHVHKRRFRPSLMTKFSRPKYRSKKKTMEVTPYYSSSFSKALKSVKHAGKDKDVPEVFKPKNHRQDKSSSSSDRAKKPGDVDGLVYVPTRSKLGRRPKRALRTSRSYGKSRHRRRSDVSSKEWKGRKSWSIHKCRKHLRKHTDGVKRKKAKKKKYRKCHS